MVVVFVRRELPFKMKGGINMDYKEEYQKALERAKMILCNLPEGSSSTRDIETIFPELKESEEDKRTKAIAVLKQQRYYWSYDGPSDKTPPATLRKDLVEAIDVALSYLEKQKEQKPERINITEMVAKYKVTDEYVEGEYKGKPVNCMIRAYEQGIRDTLLKVKEQKPVISDEAIREGVAHFGITQYQIDYWLKKHINVVEQQPAEWSEEDNRHINTIIHAIHGAGNITPIDGELAEKWLKSFRPHWTPSKEQLEALRHYVDTTTDGEIDLLYNDLKKLM